MMEKMSRIQAIKKYFGDVTNSELISLKKADPTGFRWLGDEAAKELTAEIEEGK